MFSETEETGGNTLQVIEGDFVEAEYIYSQIPGSNFREDLIGVGQQKPITNNPPSQEPIQINKSNSVEDNTTFSGISTSEITCQGNMVHAVKYDGSPACVKSSTLSKLVQRGWITVDNNSNISIGNNGTDTSNNEDIVDSTLTTMNIGEITWLESSYSGDGTGVIRLVDSDMNLIPNEFDNFDVDVWSDSDLAGIDLTMTETNESTGIFEGTIF